MKSHTAVLSFILAAIFAIVPIAGLAQTATEDSGYEWNWYQNINFLVIFLASLYGLMIFVKDFLRLSVSYSQIPFITFTFLMSVLYLAGLFGLLLPVSWFIFLAGLAYLAKTLYVNNLYFDKRGRSYLNSKRNRKLFPLGIFGILFFLNWVIFRDSMFSQWDEWLTWGLFTKVLNEYDLISTNLYDNIEHSHYPRITSILQYYFILFLNNGNFHEGTAIFSQSILISSAVPVFLYFRKNHILLLILSVFIFYCIIHLFNMYGDTADYIHVYSTYADTILGLCWGMSVILYLSNRNRKESLIIMGIVLFFLVQIKVTGLLFSFMTIFIISIDKIFFHTSKLQVKIKQICTLIAVVVFSWGSWNMYKQHNEIESLAVSNFSLNATVTIKEITSEPQEYQKSVISNWLRSMTYVGSVKSLRTDLHETENSFIAGFGTTFNLSEFSLSPLYWMTIFAIFVLLLYSTHAGRVGYMYELRNVYLTAMICLAVLVLVYSCFIMFLYLFHFRPLGAVQLVSFGRYIGTAFLGIFLVLFYLIVKAGSKFLIITFFIFVYLFTPASILGYFSPKDQGNYIYDTYFHKIIYINDIYKRIDPILEEIRKENSQSRILFINQGGNGLIFFITAYRAFPLNYYLSLERAGGGHGYSISTAERKEWEPSLWIASQEDLGKILQNIDYLIVWNDTEFFEMYGNVVERSQLKAIWKPASDGSLEKYIFHNTKTEVVSNASPPELLKIVPTETLVGVPFNVQPNGMSAIGVEGSGFNPGAQILFGDAVLPSTFGNSGWVTALVPDNLISQEGTVDVAVKNPDGKTSNVRTFKVVSKE